MQTNVIPRETVTCSADNRAGAGHRFSLTQDELQQLGMFCVGYLVSARSDNGVKITIHSADGMTVAVVDTLGLAVEIADQLGLALVAVH